MPDKFKIIWRACPCGHEACRRVRPSNMGVFYEGSGFDQAEADFLDAAIAEYVERHPDARPPE